MSLGLYNVQLDEFFFPRQILAVALQLCSCLLCHCHGPFVSDFKHLFLITSCIIFPETKLKLT